MRILAWIVLLAVMAAGTIILGWWSVPVLGAIWGLFRPRAGSAALEAALAGMGAWAVLLILSALEGPVWYLAGNLGGIFQLPGPAVLLLTLLFPAILAGGAAALLSALASILRSGGRPQRSGDAVT